MAERLSSVPDLRYPRRMIVFEFGEFRFVPQARELWRAGQRVELPRRTFECLQYLIAHRDRAVHRDELVDAIFHRPNVSDAQLGQIVLRTRRVLDDDGNAQRVIRTVAGYGYRWVAEVDEGAGQDHAVPPYPARAAAVASGSLPMTLADASAAAIDEPAVPAVSRRMRPRLRVAATLAALALVIGALSTLWMQRSKPRLADTPVQAERIVVLPMRVDGLREDAWVRLGAMDLIAERLRESGLRVPPSENVLGLLQASTAASGEIEPAIARAAAGASLVVQGNATRAATGWSVKLVAIPAQGVAVPVEFAASDAVQAARGATDLLLAALGRTSPADREHDGPLDETLQRARAAMLANELDTARSILTASPELVAAPEQLAYRLAQVDVRAGRLNQAEAALDSLLTQPAARVDPHFRAQVLIARGAARTRRGVFADGGRDFDAALAAMDGDGNALERGGARLGRANSRVAEHRYGDALADFGAARIDLESAGDLLGVARVDANMGMLELYRGRPAAALGYLPGAAERFQAFGALHELLLTLTGLIEAHLAMLQRDEAWATVERASALRERITDPDQRVDLLLNRAHVLMGNGRCREAQAALTQAGGMTTSGNRVLRARLLSLTAELAASLDHWDEAETAAAAALAEWPAAGADGDRAAVTRVRQRALLALGRDETAGALLDRTREAPRAAADDAAALDKPGAVADALAMAEWWQHTGDARRAAAWFAFATASADLRGVPAEILAVAHAQALVLLAAHAQEEAAAVVGRVAPWSARDYDAALLQLRLFHALGQREPWFNALREAQKLAGERAIPPALLSSRLPDAQAAVEIHPAR
jgi:DNA-binding winged helix-turn-helix (wHTH) protein/tetratricopeptide (TPR) repeat protein